MKIANSLSIVFIVLIVWGIGAKIPVIFIHYGDQDYLKCALGQARRYNESVILISDIRQTLDGVFWYDISAYRKAANDFEHVYKHLGSSDSYLWGLRCFQRWFILREFLNANAIERCFYCESDVMLYCDVTRKFDDYEGCDLALLDTQSNGLSSYQGHLYFGSAIYFSQEVLNSFCSYMINFYSKNFDFLNKIYSLRKIKEHSICDMTMTTHFVADFREKYVIKMLTDIINNEQFDHNMHGSENDVYEMCNLNGSIVKKIQWKGGKPYCFNKKLQKFIGFCGLHFQGETKMFMPSFAQLK